MSVHILIPEDDGEYVPIAEALHHHRGFVTFFDGEKWRYLDDGTPCHEGPPRRCARCNRPPLSSGEDACLGHIPGASSACCGHGAGNRRVFYESGAAQAAGV